MSNARSDARAPLRPSTLRDLWTCPSCGKGYVTRNMWHSCSRVALEQHFVNRPRARELFDALRAAIESQGPVTIAPNKTGIPFMTRARFVGCQVRRDYLRCHIWLKRRASSRRFIRVDQYGAKDFVHVFEIRTPDDIDDELLELLREGRAVGDQKHLLTT